MGCGAGSGCRKDDRRNGGKIDCDIENTGIGEFDEIFQEAKTILQVLEDARSGLFDTMEDIKDMCEIDRLEKPSFEECIRVWMWSISACAAGSIAKCSFELQEEKPYFRVQLSGCTWEAYWIEEAFKKFITTALEVPEKVAQAVEAIVKIVEKAMNIDPQGAIENSPLDLFEKAKAIKIFATNVKKIAEGGVQAPKVAIVVADAAVQVVTIAKNMKTWFTEADSWGQKSMAKQAYRPSEIVRLVHPGPHKTQEQLVAYEKALLEGVCTCQKCAKEQQEQAAKDTHKA